MASALDLNGYVTFTGRADRAMITEQLSRADIGLCPDLKTPLNDLSTMNKTMEYMAFALPPVSFDLVETIVSGGDSLRVVASGDIAAFADEVELLINDKELRLSLARAARDRVASLLDWRPQAEAYVGVYDSIFGAHREGGVCYPETEARTQDEWGNDLVPLDDESEFDRFILERRRPAPHREGTRP